MLPPGEGGVKGSPEFVVPVVVGVDGSAAAVRAAHWAAAVAIRFEAPLHIVHARPSLGHDFSDAVADIQAIDTELARESATAILSSARHAVEADFGGLRVTTSDVDGPADRALTELSKTARLIVLGCNELSLGTAILIGSTTVAIATNSTCPVVAWRGEMTAPTSQPIVVGIDHDDHDSRVAVTAAFELAHRLGVGVIAVHTWSAPLPAADVPTPIMMDWSEIEDGERAHLSERLAPMIKLYPDVEVTEYIDLDKPSRALLLRAKAAQLIVVGGRGRGLLAGILLGSTGLNLLHHSSVPIMICRSSDVTAKL